MNSPNHNKAITRIALPEQTLPVLIHAEGKDKTGETSWGIAVRRVTRADLDLCFRNRRQFEKKYGPIDELRRERIRFAIGLGEAIAARSVPKLKKALVRLWGDNAIARGALELARQHPLRELAGSFNPALVETSLCIWWSLIAQRLAWGVLCPSIEAALFVVALSAIGDIGALGKCKRCGELFFRARPRKKYCSDKCQAADGMRRKRERDKRKKAEQARESRKATQ